MPTERRWGALGVRAGCAGAQPHAVIVSAMGELTALDRLELHELAARYGNSIDERDWARFATVFTEDCRYELANFGRIDTIIEGRAALCAYMAASKSHPVAHLVTNVELLVVNGAVTMCSKILGTLAGGYCGAADYRDIVVQTGTGWRIADRVVTLRRPPRPPAE